MKMRLIETIDKDRLVRCAVIWSTKDQVTVKCVEPGYFDPNARCHQRGTFMADHWRLNRTDIAELEGEFDTATITDDVIRAQAEHMAGEHNDQLKVIIGKFETLVDRLLALGDAHPGPLGAGDPVSYLREFVNEPPQRYVSIVPRWLSVALADCYEARLNGAGLKMWLRISFSGGTFTPEVHIGGDQQRNYPEFVAAAREVLRELELLPVH